MKKFVPINSFIDEEEYIDQLTTCNVCGEEVPDAASRKKNWYSFDNIVDFVIK